MLAGHVWNRDIKVAEDGITLSRKPRGIYLLIGEEEKTRKTSTGSHLEWICFPVDKIMMIIFNIGVW